VGSWTFDLMITSECTRYQQYMACAIMEPHSVIPHLGFEWNKIPNNKKNYIQNR